MNYQHLTINERIVISQLKTSGVSIREISRELKRNSYRTGIKYSVVLYNPVTAQKKYEQNRLKCKKIKYKNPEINAYIKERIENHWSIEQIYHRNLHSDILSTIHKHEFGKINMTENLKDLQKLEEKEEP